MEENNKKNQKRLPGFYIALCCCVLAIGIAGYISERGQLEKTDNENQVSTVSSFPQNDAPINASDESAEAVNETVVIEDTEPVSTPAPTQTVAPANETVVDSEYNYAAETGYDYTYDNPDVEETAVIVNAEEPYFNMPAGGEIAQGFTTELSYNEALGDWRTHNGIDISADVGCSISACADGTVEEVFSDIYGEGISIKHANGFTSKYMCLGSVEELKSGDSVKAGDVIGTVGEPKGESTTEPHLHFEMYDGDIVLDPEQYLK